MPVSPASTPSSPSAKRAPRPLIRLDALPPRPRAIIASVPVGSVLLADDSAFLRAAERLCAEMRGTAKIN